MEFAFNDLSTMPLSADHHTANTKMNVFSHAYAAARRKGVRNLRSPKSTSEIFLSEDYTLYDWLNNRGVQKELRDILYGVVILPFIRDEDNKEVAKFIATDKFYFENLDNGFPKQDCLGLVTAYVYESGALSLASTPFWQQRRLPLYLQDATGNLRTEEVLNTHSSDCFECAEVKLIIENGVKLDLQETHEEPTQKNIHLTSHHGKNELEAFWKRIRQCTYVEAALSVEFGGNNFIREVTSDGYATFVLTSTSRKYALRVKTTGRNGRETQAIADYIQDNYE